MLLIYCLEATDFFKTTMDNYQSYSMLPEDLEDEEEEEEVEKEEENEEPSSERSI